MLPKPAKTILAGMGHSQRGCGGCPQDQTEGLLPNATVLYLGPSYVARGRIFFCTSSSFRWLGRPLMIISEYASPIPGKSNGKSRRKTIPTASLRQAEHPADLAYSPAGEQRKREDGMAPTLEGGSEGRLDSLLCSYNARSGKEGKGVAMFRSTLTLATLKPLNVQLHVGASDGFFGVGLAGCLRSPMRSSSCNSS